MLDLFLACDAIAGPGDGFQAFRIDFAAAATAFPECTFANALKSGFDHLQKLAVVVALGKQKFLGVGAGSAVSDVLCRVLVGNPTVFSPTQAIPPVTRGAAVVYSARP